MLIHTAAVGTCRKELSGASKRGPVAIHVGMGGWIVLAPGTRVGLRL